MNENSTRAVPRRIDRAVRLLSLDEKARLLTDRRSWSPGSAEHDRVRALLQVPAATDGVARSGIDDRGIRTLYATALASAAAVAEAWVDERIGTATAGSDRADALVAAVGRRSIDRSAVDDRVRRLLLLAARSGLSSPEATVGPTTEASASDPRSIAVIGEPGVRSYGPTSTDVSLLVALRAAMPASTIGYSLGAVLDDGVAGIPGEELTDPSTGGPGVLLRLLDAKGTEVDREDHPSADVRLAGTARETGAAVLELSTLWLPVESDRVRLRITGSGGARVSIGGQPLLDSPLAPMGWAAAELTVTAGVPVEIVVRLDLTPDAPLAIRLGTTPACFDAGRLIADAAAAARSADVAVVVVAAGAGGSGRLPGCQEDLIRAIGAANPRTVVLIDGTGAHTNSWDHAVAEALSVSDGLPAAAAAIRAVATLVPLGV